MLAVSDELGRVLWDEIARSNIASCTEYVMYAGVMLQMVAADRLRPPRPPLEELPSDPLPPPAPTPPRPTAPAPASPSDTPMPSPVPAASARGPAEGFLFNAGLSFSYGLTPTVSLGGIGSLMYRRGEYSGALEARVDHGLVPAHFRAFPVESLFVGATLALPCAHLRRVLRLLSHRGRRVCVQLDTQRAARWIALALRARAAREPGVASQ